jgi:hypothetical protein
MIMVLSTSDDFIVAPPYLEPHRERVAALVYEVRCSWWGKTDAVFLNIHTVGRCVGLEGKGLIWTSKQGWS